MNPSIRNFYSAVPNEVITEMCFVFRSSDGGTQTIPDIFVPVFAVNETIIGTTRYDIQTNSSVQNRINVFDDGTMGATWIMGFTETAFTDRGAGYNYFNGSTLGI